MADIASLGIAIRSDQVKDASAQLQAFTTTATAAEQATKKLGVTANTAAASNDNFSRRVRNVVSSLEFERQQLARSAAEREKYASLRRAGVTAASAEGQAILASISALQAQRAAATSTASSTSAATVATQAGTKAFHMLREAIIPLAAAFGVAETARKIWEAGMKAGDIGEQAEQVNLSTDALQAYRFNAIQNGIEVEKLDQGIIKFTATLGNANRGNKESIELFDKLGVKILDANNELRPTQDLLPEVARGLLAMNSETERNATLTELFGKSGARMVTMLKAWAEGNDAVIDSAKAQGGVLDSEVIDAWDRVSDAMKRAGAASDVTLAKLGAPIVTTFLDEVAKLLARINGLMDAINSKKGFWATILEESRATGRMGGLRLSTPEEEAADRLAALQKERDAQDDPGRRAMVEADIARLSRAAATRQLQTPPVFQANALGIPGAAFRTLPSVGRGQPVAKGGGGSDPFAKATESARDYIAAKQAETAAIGQSVEAAARLKHEQELVNKASADGRNLTAARVAQLKQLAAAMAEADAAFATAKFMDDFNTKSRQFLANQQLEQDALFLSAEAANRLKIETEALNDARQKGIDLSPAQVDSIRQAAADMAAAAEQTRLYKETVDLAKDVASGFFTDLLQGLEQGKSLWQSFGDAATAALNKIADKLLSMAVDSLWEKALGPAAKGLFGSIFGGGANIAAGSGSTYANGAAFLGGNVIPFARGGIVSRPTVFPMANGMGLMGEAGPEGVLPLRRASNGRLGVEASGAGGNVVVNIINNADGTKVTQQQRQTSNGREVTVMIDAIKASIASDIGLNKGPVPAAIKAMGGGARR